MLPPASKYLRNRPSKTTNSANSAAATGLVSSRKKIYQVDPLTCTRCGAIIQIISFIEDPPVIKKTLLHLHLWEVPKRAPPSNTPPRDFVYNPHFFAGLTG